MDTNTIQTNVETAAPAPVIQAFDKTKTYASGDKFIINFDGKPITVTFVRPGVVQKTASIFYIRDCTSGEWLYCFPARLENLIKKGVDLANYKGRDAKAAERKAEKAQKLVDKEARAKAAQEAAAAALLKVQNTVPNAPVVPTAPVAPTAGETAAPAASTEQPPAETAPTQSADELKKIAEREERAAASSKRAAAKK